MTAKKQRAVPPKDIPPKPAPDATGETRVAVPAETETPPPRKKTGRPSNSSREEAKRLEALEQARQLDEQRQRWRAQGEVIAEQGDKLILGVSHYIARRMGPQWEFTDSERHELGVAAGTVLAKYTPQWVDAYREEIGLAWAVLAIVGARMMIAASEQQPEAEEQPEAEKPKFLGVVNGNIIEG